MPKYIPVIVPSFLFNNIGHFSISLINRFCYFFRKILVWAITCKFLGRIAWFISIYLDHLLLIVWKWEITGQHNVVISAINYNYLVCWIFRCQNISWARCSICHETCPLQWRHNDHGGISNHQHRDCLPRVYWSADQRKYQSSASLAFVRGIHRGPGTKGQ